LSVVKGLWVGNTRAMLPGRCPGLVCGCPFGAECKSWHRRKRFVAFAISPGVVSRRLTNLERAMYTDAPTDQFMRSLAEEIAFGGNVAEWARTKEVNALVAREWTELPEFRVFVEKCRVAHAERMVGKIATCVERAIDRLVELSESARSPSVALAATRSIIKYWMDLSIYFVQERTFQSLSAQLKVLQEAKKAEKKAMRNGWVRY
jgi:hypothetical protein